ncbi:MAG: DUF3152 domain-containing protein [Actinomycetota bacterium]|nr:DUF3152 domain-containing protein [Actinomycetota bacterium]
MRDGGSPARGEGWGSPHDGPHTAGATERLAALRAERRRRARAARLWRRDLLLSVLVAALAVGAGQVASARLSPGSPPGAGDASAGDGPVGGVPEAPNEVSAGGLGPGDVSAGGEVPARESLGPGARAGDGPPTRPGDPDRTQGIGAGSVAKPTGKLRVVPGSSRAKGPDAPLRFMVEVEGGLNVDRRAFAARVEHVLFDKKGWRAGGVSFKRVDSGRAAFRVALASRALTDRLCAPLATVGLYSCYQGGRSVLNFWRWKNGADAYGRRLYRYRIYMINHEVGHALGHGHAVCPGPGRLAPLMVQQTIGVGACRPNPWPLAHEH